MDIIIGPKSNPIATDNLTQELNAMGIDGILYIGYPVLASADEAIFVDALFLSEKYGLVVFHFPKNNITDSNYWDEISETQDDLFVALNQKLMSFKPLRSGRKLAINPSVICYIPTEVDIPPAVDSKVIVIGKLTNTFSTLKPIDVDYMKPLVSAIQRVSTLKPERRRSSVVKAGSKGAILKVIEKDIANLDTWQNHAAIETPDAPQCIRGLAGSGKTVVLALKAALLHARHPDWNIVVTYHTRSLYQQLKFFIRRFSFEQSRDEPDWTKLKIMHSWGSRAAPGVYSEIALAYGLQPKNFTEARLQYGNREAFGGVCQELLNAVRLKPSIAPYDIILIDEAQDFPSSFFQLVYSKAIGAPHRIVWAYDELQNLGDYVVLPPEELFGVNEENIPFVQLTNEDGKPKQDITLPICYRNTPWALTVAHAVGFGIYRKDGLVQLFENSSETVWKNLGYDVLGGSVESGKNVSLKRGVESAPKYFYDCLTSEDAVQTIILNNSTEQAKWVAENIQKNLMEDELEASDILVILPDPISAVKQSGPIRGMLKSLGINSHIAGITTSLDQLFSENSIAITGIYRAKGNEASMVYILNAQHCYDGSQLIKRRNTLFTAITRSKAWVRICGYGDNMQKLAAEINEVAKNNFQLNFKVPSPEQLAELKTIYRDITRDEQQKLRGLEEVVNLLEKGELSIEHIPKSIRERLKKQLGP